MRMKVYQSKPRITLSPAIRDGQKYVEVEFDEDDAIRLSLSKEKGVRFEGDRAYLPEEGFDLSGFFDRHVETAYWKSHATLTLLATQDLPTFGYNMIDPLKSWCWGSILFYPFKISRFS